MKNSFLANDRSTCSNPSRIGYGMGICSNWSCCFLFGIIIFRLVFLLACAIIALLFGIGNVLRLHYVGVNSVRIELLALGDSFSPNRVAFAGIPGFYQN